jgi:hypothetical protein
MTVEEVFDEKASTIHADSAEICSTADIADEMDETIHRRFTNGPHLSCNRTTRQMKCQRKSLRQQFLVNGGGVK